MTTIVEHEHTFDLFGTRVRLLVGAPAPERLEAQIAALRVQARLTRIHTALTRFDPTSELCRLNEHDGTTVSISPTMRDAIAAALHAAKLSDGLVDPTVLPHVENAGYATSRTGLPPADLTAALAAAPTRRPARSHRIRAWQQIDLGAPAGTVRIPAGSRLDLGGSAKGMAVDIAARMLADAPTFVVDAGGDIRLGGSQARRRTVLIDHPLPGYAAHELALTNGAAATSGLRTRVWQTADGYAHHLIDPGRGEPAWTGVVQATALAPTALEAETLAKTALLRGPDDGLETLARHGGALILDDGRLILTGKLEPRYSLAS